MPVGGGVDRVDRFAAFRRLGGGLSLEGHIGAELHQRIGRVAVDRVQVGASDRRHRDVARALVTDFARNDHRKRQAGEAGDGSTPASAPCDRQLDRFLELRNRIYKLNNYHLSCFY